MDHSRLWTARHYRGLSILEISEKVSISLERLQELDRPEAIPNVFEALQLGRVLDWPHGFFFLPPIAGGHGYSWRHGRDEAGDSCRWCGRRAKFLCDHLMPDGGTCDRPLCPDHAHQVGPDLHRCPDHV